jgi:DNA-binding transcriptional ArsR family regulator
MKKDVFQAIADPTRRAILILLATHAMTPNTVAEQFNVSRQAISKHINIFAECQLLRKEKSGREIHYQFNPDKMKEVDQWLEILRQKWTDRFMQLDEVLMNLKNEKK